MRRLFPLNPNRTLITLLMSPTSINEAIAEALNAEYDGADAAAFEFRNLPKEGRTEDELKRLFDTIPIPVMAILYRNDMYNLNDDDRQKFLLMAAKAGAGMVDVIGDLYDPSNDQRTRNAKAINKQKRLIDKFHKLGSQVVISSHPCRFMKCEEVVEQLKDFESRGADVVKIVTVADSAEEFAESVKTTLVLRKELKAPFIHLCGGRYARIQRQLGTSLGSAITFAIRESHDGTAVQPTIKAFKAVQDNMHWHVSQFPDNINN